MGFCLWYVWVLLVEVEVFSWGFLSRFFELGGRGRGREVFVKVGVRIFFVGLRVGFRVEEV